MKKRYNVVVVGRTGVGKSSFINYIYGQDVMKTGTGKPVTEKDAFECIEININDLPVRIFDSWGLEADKHEEWKKSLEKEFEKRDVTSDISDWFHTVFYCISAGSGRVQDFEIETMNEFIKKRYKVNVIFTKADQSSEAEIKELSEVIDEEVKGEVEKIPVCNEEKKLMNGNKVEQFGKEKIIKMIDKGFWDSIKMRLPKRVEQKIFDEVDAWCLEQKEYIEESVNLFNAKKMKKFMKKKMEEFKDETLVELINKEIKDILKVYNIFVENISFEGDKSFGEGKSFVAVYNKAITLEVIKAIITVAPFHPILFKGLFNRLKGKKNILKAIDGFNKKMKKEIQLGVIPKISDVLEEIKKEDR
ncbi:GTPase domain-containing protein [Natroniella sp. ANB-PHB2]|uniref:GTPase domain-containing protein n=1 Tax=Natroniella sp. ANB-PHB2 TaxID=3384444 RepID=UPI0038D40E65